ncbi:MAG TPA: prepilin-type N-terminal cleavage/methylation domain-containing protein [Terriglobia bacterium]
MLCNKDNSRAGFTLIEVLVSITIMAMVGVIVLSATRSGLAMWDKGGAHIERLHRSRVVLDVLNDQIRGALPMSYTVRTSERTVSPLAFDGTASSLRFLSRTSFKDGPDGVPRWVTIQWASGELKVEERRILPPDNAPDPSVYWHDTVLRGDSCAFGFLTDAQPNRPAVWVQAWHFPANPVLPRAVRLSCAIPPKNDVQAVIPLDYAAASATGLVLR